MMFIRYNFRTLVDRSPGVGNYGLYILGGLLVISAILIWLNKRRLKRQLSAGLGRQASDRDLTSISSWMKSSDKDK